MTKLLNLIKRLNVITRNSINSDSTKINYSITRSFCEKITTCWKCGAKKGSSNFFCPKCNIIQEPTEKGNFFKILGVDERFDVDLKVVTKKFRELQNRIHPDKYSNRSEKEKSFSQEHSSIINHAYKNLVSPIERGLHLLSLKGESISEDDKNTDKEFLMEIMEMNEEVEEADTPESLLKLRDKNRDILNSLQQQLTDSFNNNDIVKAKNSLIRMKYYNSISVQINGILRERGIVE